MRREKASKKMKAAFNIALYYEIKDNVEQAKEWLGKAKKLVKSGSRDEQLIAFYSLELEKRESKLSQLRIQMKRFDDNF
mgnify:FL=1